MSNSTEYLLSHELIHRSVWVNLKLSRSKNLSSQVKYCWVDRFFLTTFVWSLPCSLRRSCCICGSKNKVSLLICCCSPPTLPLLSLIWPLSACWVDLWSSREKERNWDITGPAPRSNQVWKYSRCWLGNWHTRNTDVTANATSFLIDKKVMCSCCSRSTYCHQSSGQYWTCLCLCSQDISKAASNPKLFPRVFHNNKFLPTKSPKQYQKWRECQDNDYISAMQFFNPRPFPSVHFRSPSGIAASWSSQ